jgi:hypothetical protein
MCDLLHIRMPDSAPLSGSANSKTKTRVGDMTVRQLVRKKRKERGLPVSDSSESEGELPPAFNPL